MEFPVVHRQFSYHVIETEGQERFADSLESYVNEGWDLLHVSTQLTSEDSVIFVALLRISQ